MTKPFEKSLARLRNVSIAVAAGNIPDASGTASVIVKFADGTVLRAAYWRLIETEHEPLSSFDHQQQYGLSAPIDAKEQLSDRLDGKLCHEVQFDAEAGDLTLIFDETMKLQVFNFTGYEIWDLSFPDGTGEYSNYARR